MNLKQGLSPDKDVKQIIILIITIIIITIIIIIIITILTIAKVYETRRFNAAFVRALQ